MPKKRKAENKALPARWRYKHGAYYYRVPPGLEYAWDGKKDFRLGATLTEAYRTWAEKLPEVQDAKTIGDLLDRYALEVVPLKAYETQQSNLKSIPRLKLVFGHMPLAALKPSHAYKYLDITAQQHGKHTANRDFEVLSHAFSKAVEWGLIDRNPVKGQVRKLKTKRRERYVEDWEIVEVLKVASPLLRAYIAVKLITGLRRGDILRLQMEDIREDGVHVKPHKTEHSSGVSLLILWNDDLRTVIDIAIDVRPKTCVPWLFHTRQGKPYINEKGRADGFDSIWSRFMGKALSQTKLKERFQERDLRKKVGSDMKIELASSLLGHTSVATTRRHYRLRPEEVQPHSVNFFSGDAGVIDTDLDAGNGTQGNEWDK